MIRSIEKNMKKKWSIGHFFFWFLFCKEYVVCYHRDTLFVWEWMKILTRNVNGIRAVMKKSPSFIDIIQAEQPDIICLQETKAFAHQKPVELWLLPHTHVCWHAGQRAGYAGTAILSQHDFVNTCNTHDHSMKFHEDGRITEVELEGKILLINGYFPNGWTRADGTEMLTYKLAFYDELSTYIQSRQDAWYEIILTGDMNIVHTEIDIARPKANENTIWFTPPERKRIGDFMEECKLTDMFRHFHPDMIDEYTRWSYRAWARARNVWRRIDYFMLSEGLLHRAQSFRHRQDIMGSDHCPIELVIK